MQRRSRGLEPELLHLVKVISIYGKHDISNGRQLLTPKGKKKSHASHTIFFFPKEKEFQAPISLIC